MLVRHMGDTLWAIVWYCSALAIPAAYVAGTRFQGVRTRKMLRGAGLQVLCCVAWAMVGFALGLMHVPDIYKYPLWLAVINLAFVIYFLSVLIRRVPADKESRRNA
jgi:hypothetical protein